MLNTPVSETTSIIRSIIRNDIAARREGVSVAFRLNAIHVQLAALEQDLPSRDPSAFETANLDAFGYATVLGYMNEHDPLTLIDPDFDPVRDTIAVGKKAAEECRKAGLKVVRVPAPEHVTQRYAKVTHVNAYPVAVLAKVTAPPVTLTYSIGKVPYFDTTRRGPSGLYFD